MCPGRRPYGGSKVSLGNNLCGLQGVVREKKYFVSLSYTYIYIYIYHKDLLVFVFFTHTHTHTHTQTHLCVCVYCVIYSAKIENISILK